MKALLLNEAWDIKLIDKEIETPKEGEAVIKIMSAGICGSDISALRGQNNLVTYPRIPGHELAGVVQSIPENNKNNIKVGDKVVVDPYLYCGKCYPCSIGRTNCCENLKVLGVHINGGIAEQFCHPADMLIKIPDDMEYALAAMAEPLSISLHGIHRLKLKKGENIAIIGAGTIGLLAALIAEYIGAIPILIDLVASRLDTAKALGIKHVINPINEDAVEIVKEITNGTMAQCVLEASGANSAVLSSLDLVSFAGRIALTGWTKVDTPLPTYMITKKEIDIRGARTSAREIEECIDLIYNNQIDVKKLLTKTINIDEAVQTIKDIEKYPSDFIKVVINF